MDIEQVKKYMRAELKKNEYISPSALAIKAQANFDWLGEEAAYDIAEDVCAEKNNGRYNMKDWKCQECGKEFNKTAPKDGEMTCPGCGSTDIDVCTNSKRAKLINDRINKGKESYGSAKHNAKCKKCGDKISEDEADNFDGYCADCWERAK